MGRLLGIVAVALISTACRPGQPTSTAQHAPTAITASTTPVDATPMPAASPSNTPPAACPPPWGVCTASSAIGNFDGRGQKEVLTASPIQNGSGAIVDWLLEVTAPDSRSVSARLSGLIAARGGCPALDGPYAIVLGAANIAGPSRDLAFVEINHGASTRFGILVGIDGGGGLGLATVANGAEQCQRVFPFSGSVTQGNGLACGWRGSVPVLWVRQVADSPPDYADYNWYQSTYSWQGLKLYLLSLEHAVITTGDARFEPSYAVACGSVSIRG